MDGSLGGVQHRLDPDHAAQKRCVFAQIALADFSFRLHEPDLFGSLTWWKPRWTHSVTDQFFPDVRLIQNNLSSVAGFLKMVR